MKLLKSQLKMIIENFLLENKRETKGEILIHKVKPGENITLIANRYQLPVVNGRQGAEQIMWLNNITKEETTKLQIGQELKIPMISQYVVKSGDTLSEIAEDFGVGLSFLKSYNNLRSNSIGIGQTLLIPPQNPGVSSPPYNYEDEDYNLNVEPDQGTDVVSLSKEEENIEDNKSFFESIGEMFSSFFGDSKEETIDTALEENEKPTTNFNGNYPLDIDLVLNSVPSPFRILSHQQQKHEGIDFAAAIGSKVYSLLPGTVLYAGYAGGYQNYVCIDHHNGYCSFYGHLTTISSKIKKPNEAYDVSNPYEITAENLNIPIGTSGGSPPHLHLEYKLKERTDAIGLNKGKKYEFTDPDAVWKSSFDFLRTLEGIFSFNDNSVKNDYKMMKALVDSGKIEDLQKIRTGDHKKKYESEYKDVHLLEK